jgi:hypothetical protein
MVSIVDPIGILTCMSSMRAKGILFILVAFICVVAIYLTTQAESSGPAIGTSEFSLRIENQILLEGSPLLRADEGDTVILHVTSDKADTLHVHGYEVSADLKPGIESILTFLANDPGKFTFELEKNHAELGVIEVMP